MFNNDDGWYYIDYENGKLVRDGWTRPSLKRTGEKVKFRFDGKIVEKTIYLYGDREVIKHDDQIIYVNR